MMQAGGDLSGTASSNTVIGIDGFPVVFTSSATNQTIIYNGTTWVNSAINFGGDISGTNGAMTVVGIQGVAVSSTAPYDGQVLEFITGTGWKPGNLAYYLPTTGPASFAVTISGALVYTYNISTEVIYFNDLTFITGYTTQTINLPSSFAQGQLLYIGSLDFASNLTTITVVPHAGTTLNGSSSSQVYSRAGCVLICYDGTNWANIGAVL